MVIKLKSNQTKQAIDVCVNVDNQTASIGDLIEQYVSKRSRLASLLRSGTADSDNLISKAEVGVDAAFEALLEADLKHNHEISERMNFLIGEIRQSLDAGTIHDKMAQTIERDVGNINRIN